MATRESNIFKECQLAAAEFMAVLLRNNRGMFLTIDGKRKVRAGLDAPGSSDGIGWCSKIITPDMVGKRVAVFLAVEAKHESRISPAQQHFIDEVNRAGGIGLIAYSPDDVLKALKNHE